VPIDVTVPGSPGWWMQTLWRQLAAETPRLNRLEAYWRGEPSIVIGSERLQSAYYRFQNMARSNFAQLIGSAMTNRMAVRSIRTAAADDDNGDEQAWRHEGLALAMLRDVASDTEQQLDKLSEAITRAYFSHVPAAQAVGSSGGD